jgi:hypothetical protein
MVNNISLQARKISAVLPDEYSLSQNQPNPFNPVTTISFELPEATTISLTVFNILGQKVATLAEGEFNAGVHRLEWNAVGQPSGVYLYRLDSEEFVQTKKMLLLK